MESKLLELARAVVNVHPADFCIVCETVNTTGDDGHAPDCAWLQLKNEVERLDSQTAYKPQGESLEFAQPRKPMEYEA